MIGRPGARHRETFSEIFLDQEAGKPKGESPVGATSRIAGGVCRVRRIVVEHGSVASKRSGIVWGLSASAVALLLASCAGGAEADPAPVTTAPPTVTTLGSPAQASTPTTTPASPEPDEGPDRGGGADGEFCQDLADDNQRSFDVLDPATVETHFTESLVVLAELGRRVPSEIAADFEVVHNNAVELAALLAEYDYEMMSVPEEELAAMTSDEVLQASIRIGDYCGFDLG